MTAEVEKEFLARMRELLVEVPYDLKALFEAMSDQDLPREARRTATGTVIYCLALADPIPDHLGIVGFVDDAVIVRLGLQRFLELAGKDGAGYPQRFPEQFERLAEDLTLLKQYLGDSMGWLEKWLSAEHLKDVKYKGKTVDDYVDDDQAGQRLYDEALEFTTDYELDDDEVRRLTSGKTVLDAFEKRRQFEASRR